jgi:hypothetical protein
MAPPFGTAVNVTLVPAGCGAGLFELSATAVNRAPDVGAVGAGEGVVVVPPEIG